MGCGASASSINTPSARTLAREAWIDPATAAAASPLVQGPLASALPARHAPSSVNQHPHVRTDNASSSEGVKERVLRSTASAVSDRSLDPHALATAIHSVNSPIVSRAPSLRQIIDSTRDTDLGVNSVAAGASAPFPLRTSSSRGSADFAHVLAGSDTAASILPPTQGNSHEGLPSLAAAALKSQLSPNATFSLQTDTILQSMSPVAVPVSTPTAALANASISINAPLPLQRMPSTTRSDVVHTRSPAVEQAAGTSPSRALSDNR